MSGDHDDRWILRLGASLAPGGGATFRVWAPLARCMEVLRGRRRSPMASQGDGHFSLFDPDARAGDRYFFLIDGKKRRPDPASLFQPQGVHGPSQIVDLAFPWTDRRWKAPALKDLVFYEMHVGAFTREGTLEAARKKLPYLKDLGVNCVELMPLAQFPGRRNWGYDGVGLYAVQNSYGGPRAFQRFVDDCHRHGLAVCLDVVYNHFGPEGNYLRDFGPYFTSKYRTPWGEAVNYDDAGSNGVRRFVTENALYWFRDHHVDALRLDAVHAIYDLGARHVLAGIKDEAAAFSAVQGRPAYVIAESDLNDPRVVREVSKGGWGLDAQWSDDWHHAAHVALTGEKTGYYRDFSGLADLAAACSRTFVYDGRFSRARQRLHGASAEDVPAERFITFLQNHDQIGNRAMGDRLASVVSPRSQAAMAALLCFLPSPPLFFMGQEYGEKAPFLYFVDHGDPSLVEAVRKGRREEFSAFGWEEVPDPKKEKTFLDSKLRWAAASRKEGRELLRVHRRLFSMRKRYGWAGGARPDARLDARGVLHVRRRTRQGSFLLQLIPEGVDERVPGRTIFENSQLSGWQTRRSCYNFNCRIQLLSVARHADP